MSIFLSLQKNNLHHAYVCVGDVDSIQSDFEDFLSEHLLFPIVGNPDYRVFEDATLSINTARLIGIFQSQKNLSGERQIFVIKTGYIGEEAQNALLKIFEEPTQNTHFFVFLPQDTLLPTLRSRVQVLHQYNNEKIKTSFLKLSLPERLSYIKKITEDISDEKKTKQHAIDLINQIEQELYQGGGVEKYSQELALCEKARTALFARGSMTKMILENVALSV
ncbi:MAG: hypothetical protein ACYCZW_00100 [Minisyncoccota bacterium]